MDAASCTTGSEGLASAFDPVAGRVGSESAVSSSAGALRRFAAVAVEFGLLKTMSKSSLHRSSQFPAQMCRAVEPSSGADVPGGGSHLK